MGAHPHAEVYLSDMFNINLEKFLTNWVVSVKPWLAKLTVTNTSRNSSESIGHWDDP